MFGGFFDKAVTATISLGMMLFSSYQGNTPSFGEVHSHRKGNRVFVQTRLENAFNEDFRQILQSGQEVKIDFTLSLKSNDRTEIICFSHLAVFDPLMEIWTLCCQEQGNQSYNIESWQEFINANSDFNYSGIHYLTNPIEVELIAQLPTMQMGHNNKSFDLMIFWNYHKPGCRSQIP